MRPPDALACLTRDARLTELAVILAAAILRLRVRMAVDPSADANEPPTCLEGRAEPVLSGPTG